MLDVHDIEAFVRDGAVRLPEAVPRDVVDDCRALLWSATGCDENDPLTWTEPVIRIDYRDDGPFRSAADTPALREAFDALVGVGRWTARTSIGTFPIRFPHARDPGDTGWHVESTGLGADGRAVVDPQSRERMLLLLYLLGDVESVDGPTLLRAGSHRAAADILLDADAPLDHVEASAAIERRTRGLSEVEATGRAGDVWLCHPFVLHRAQPNRGTRVRFLAQPPLPGPAPLDRNRAPADRSPVEQAMLSEESASG